MERMGRKNKYYYHILQHAWYAYLRMVNIDYTASLTCPICKDNPEVIIMDGVTMGTSKEVPETDYQYDENQQYSPIPLTERLFVANKHLRKQLQEYSQNGLRVDRFNELLDLLMDSLADYIRHSNTYKEDIVNICQSFPNVKSIVNLLRRPEPITGLFQFSILTSAEQQSVVQLSMGKAVDHSIILPICRRMNSLSILFNSFEKIQFTGGQLILHPIVAKLLGAILVKINILYTHPTRIPFEIEASCESYCTYFPGFTKNYR